MRAVSHLKWLHHSGLWQAGGNCRYSDRLNGRATTSDHRNWRTFRARRNGSVTETLNRVLGLQADLKGFYRYAAKDARLSVLARRFRGVKPPQFPSLLEALVNGIACQQFSLASGIQMLNRLSEKFGTPLIGDRYSRPYLPQTRRPGRTQAGATAEPRLQLTEGGSNNRTESRYCRRQSRQGRLPFPG